MVETELYLVKAWYLLVFDISVHVTLVTTEDFFASQGVCVYNSDNPDLEINNKTFKGVLLQSLLPSWDQFVDSLHHTRMARDDPAPSLNIVHLMRTLKDKYYC